MDDFIGNEPLPPGRSREIPGEGIDGTPTVQSLAEPFHLLRAQTSQSARMVVEQLVGNPTLLSDQFLGNREDVAGRRVPQALGVIASDTTDSFGRPVVQGSDRSVDLICQAGGFRADWAASRSGLGRWSWIAPLPAAKRAPLLTSIWADPHSG